MRLSYLFAKSIVIALQTGVLSAGACLAQQSAENLCPMLPSSPATPGHPHPQPRPPASKVNITHDQDGVTVLQVKTGQGCFAESDPYQNPPGTNFLPTIFTNAFDGNNHEMVNTLPSTDRIPYNLHDGNPVVAALCASSKFEDCRQVPGSALYDVGANVPFSFKSPTDDLLEIFDQIDCNTPKQCKFKKLDPTAIKKNFQRGIDILEGNPIPDRLYSGLPLLHYKAREKVRAVAPVLGYDGKAVGGNVNIHQVWYDTHVESDVAFLDPTLVADVPWTITYTIDVLSRGNDDFSPFVMYFDDPALSKPPMPHVAMDQTFFNMEEGTRTVFKIKMAPGKYYNLTYNWGWRAHPPRVQVTENATKRIPPNPNGKTLVQWEEDVFGGKTKEQAIAMIGDLAPEKRMWTAFRAGLDAFTAGNYAKAALSINQARDAFSDWRDRDKLPRGIPVDKNSDLTLFYANNTIYGQFKEGTRSDFPKWKTRGAILKVTLLNGDYFDHGYQNVDFGGARGWENQFQSSVESGGSGPWFTFGRVHWWMNIPMLLPDGKPLIISAATHRPNQKDICGRYNSSDTCGKYKVEITYEYEPSRRLRFYQFDPMHHDVAVFSVH
ncbi:MAG TPA: hypothetical protein VHA33_02150 [Candidatus Angelobacter sp.]|nr:hypothetical protein [Candidatus Angelobacter sp.]